MRPRPRALAALTLVTVLAMVLPACGSSTGNAKPPTSGGSGGTTGGVVPQGGSVVIGAEQEPSCFDWIATCSGSNWGTWMAQIQTQPLAWRDVMRNGQLVEVPGAVLAGPPKFATSPVETITYDIAPAAIWSDGVPISCADFQYTATQEQTSPGIYDRTGYVDIAKVSCPTPKTAVVTYKQGKTYAGWHSLFASGVGILPSHLLKGKNRDKALKDGYTWSGGPWFAKWNKGDSIVLTPNPRFWGPKPHLDKVVFRFETDTAAEFQAFKSGQVDAIYPQPEIDVVDAINAGLPGAHTQYQSQTGSVEALWFNLSRFPFDSKAVRQAFGYAIDRDAVVNKLFGALGVTKAWNSLDPFVVGAYADLNAWSRYHLDLSKVTTLMTGAGWQKGSDGIWAKGGRRAAFTIMTTAGDKRRELTEQIIQPMLKAAGFDMKIKNTSSDNLFGTVLPAGDYQLSLYANGLTSITPGLCSILCTENIPGPSSNGSGNNTSFASIPAADVQMRIVDNSLDENARKAAGKKSDEILADANVALPLDPLPDIVIWSNKIVGPVSDNPIEGMFWNIDQWGVKK